MPIADSAFVHPLADVADCSIGPRTRVWQFVVIFYGATIGADCNICAQTLVEGDVQIGDRVTVKSGVQLWDGLRIADDVFIGPNVTFTNDPFPRSRMRQKPFCQTHIGHGASLGAGAVVLPGVTIGAGAMVGAGAVVTRDVAPGSVVVGNPARLLRWAEDMSRE